MTKAAKAYGKQLQHFWNAEETRPYCCAMARRIGTLSTSKSDDLSYGLKDVVLGKGKAQGTWAHPKLAVFFARWLDVEFAVWCDMVIDSLLRGQTTINIQVDTPAEVLRVPETAGALRASATYTANMAQHPD